ncbi:MAG: hypothetical protein JSR33_07545 [Proteobacteria bacterium]|nr:hypothetical protein [Pseudomonadota bacterium]
MKMNKKLIYNCLMIGLILSTTSFADSEVSIMNASTDHNYQYIILEVTDGAGHFVYQYEVPGTLYFNGTPNTYIFYGADISKELNGHYLSVIGYPDDYPTFMKTVQCPVSKKINTSTYYNVGFAFQNNHTCSILWQ